MAGGELDELVHRAGLAVSAGNQSEAIALLRSAAAAAPDDPRALNAIGNGLLAANRPHEACAQFERAVAVDPAAEPVWLNLSAAYRKLGDSARESVALDGALKANPYSTLALLLKAQLLERVGDGRAPAVYASLIACAPPDAQLSPAMAAALGHARAVVAAQKNALGDEIRAAVKDAGVSSVRFDRAIDILTGEQQKFLPQPSGIYFPHLPAVPFFDEACFPWFAELEAHTAVVRDELMAVIARDRPMRPYIAIKPGTPVNQWAALNQSLDWSAFFLWENGIPNEANLKACPRTATLLENIPLLDIPGRAPTAIFSILKPGAVIPPHTGVSNLRAIVHLPLVVPDDCGLRVGAETRAFREGRAWAFDDTIEHEAWNRSTEPRAVLIMDTWNPFLTSDERTLLRLTVRALRSRLDV